MSARVPPPPARARCACSKCRTPDVPRMVLDPRLRLRLADQRAGSAPARCGGVDTAAELTVRRGKAVQIGLLAAAGAAGLLGYTIAGARRTGTELDAALRKSIGDGYLDELDLPGPPRPAAPPRIGRPPVQLQGARHRGAARRALHRGRPQGAPRHPSPQGRQPRRCARADPGPRRWLDDRQQGAAGHPPDEPDGSGGLGLRVGQLPARAEVQVPDADRRREASDRLGPREHQGVRRRLVVRRHHRRLGGRPPRCSRCADSRSRRLPARLRGG